MGPAVKPITIVTGHFGSGKTEITINLALRLRSQSAEAQVALADLDLVNPYFRSREVRHILAAKGITAVIPPEEFLTSEMPALPVGIINTVRQAKDGNFKLVIDLGGDEQGIVVLGQLKPELNEGDYTVWLVVNPYRPFSRNIEEITATIRRIEAIGRISVRGLISNPHLLAETQLETIVDGHRIVRETAERLRIPVVALAVHERFTERLRESGIQEEIWPITLFTRPAWLDPE